MLAAGTFAGLLSGLLGIGGGVLLVPTFNQLAHRELKTSLATSLACVALFAVPGSITHALLGEIDWRFALLLAVGIVPGARFGAALAIRARDHRLRVAVAAFLGLVAVVFAVGEMASLLWRCAGWRTGATGAPRRAALRRPASQARSDRTRPNTSSSIAGVSRPVKVFCWLTW